MARLQDWKRCPSTWINDGGLRSFKWTDGGRSAHLSALMCWAVIIHHANDDGDAVVTYDTFNETTGMGRTLISKGLISLAGLNVIERVGKSGFHLTDYDEFAGWAKFPLRGLYRTKHLTLFHNLTRRQSVELDALKLLFLIVARRDNNTNTANITYDQITKLSGIRKDRILAALSLLAANLVVMVEARPSSQSEFGIHNAYRIQGIDSHNHRGTTARKNI